MVDSSNPYSEMQRNQYNSEAGGWSLENKNPVIGNYDAHLAYDDYADLLPESIRSTNSVALDFGCGPGRNLVRFTKAGYFGRIDGVDISEVCLEKAKINLQSENIDPSLCKLYLTNGVDLQAIASDSYDVVFSTITLQHICVHEIRFNLFTEFYRVLKSGGTFTAQMGHGNRQGGHDYFANSYDATGTNGWNDVMVSNAQQLQEDLEKIGFRNFTSHLTETRGGDVHDNWIYFSAQK